MIAKLIPILLIFMLLFGGNYYLNSTKSPAVISQGKLIVCQEERSISFPGVVRAAEGWVQFLIYAPGYHWLEEKSAITTPIKLKELQQALAQLDWQLWDQLWVHRKNVSKLQVLIQTNGQQYVASQLTSAQDKLGLLHIIFLGCPYFDPIALTASTAGICSACPIFPLEYEALQKNFVRSSGDSGYELANMPPLGTQVQIKILVKE